MSAPAMTGFAIKGWCPGALRPMLSGDGLVVRIRPPLGRLTPAQARASPAPPAHGNGLIDLTARANLQLRGVSTRGASDAARRPRALGLIDADVETEARRNLLVTPLWAEGDGTLALATALSRRWPKRPPCHKSSASRLIQARPRPDRSLRRHPARAPRRWLPAPARRWRAPRPADHRRPCRPERLPSPTGSSPPAAHPMAGAAWPRHLASGIALPDGYATPAQAPVEPPRPGLHPSGALVGLAFGQFTAETLASLATDPIRITPWRMILLEGATACPTTRA